VATGAWNGCVRVWDASIGMYLHSVKMNNTVWRIVALAPDHFAVCVGEDLLSFSHRHCDDVALVREVAGAHDHTDVFDSSFYVRRARRYRVAQDRSGLEHIPAARGAERVHGY
jgi:hypothetical protein